MGGTIEEDDSIVCIDQSFFMNDDYQLKTFTFGSQILQLYCLQSASTDFDLTGQLVWPGAMLMNDYLSKNAEILRGCSVLELGSGVGITGVLCSRFCRKVIMTDHNDEVIKILNKNVAHHSSDDSLVELMAEKLEWGNTDHLSQICEKHPEGFDMILGADICFQQVSIPFLFDTVKELLDISRKKKRHCKFLLAYVSRAKVMDSLVISEAIGHGLQIDEIAGSQTIVGNLQGRIYEITQQ
ncbi:protein N-lysine methyltransferase METTL21A [Impatiens glandulifera]|uniref:protein N-lysine methyltransferase METTL21A n=1 Tax=Impatiens glandulifera TaxID=253017 RepID=UPI001FB11618|nr:protein N-lysine methyltransferase METTL21A [Impatiens glandulifera]